MRKYLKVNCVSMPSVKSVIRDDGRQKSGAGMRFGSRPLKPYNAVKVTAPARSGRVRKPAPSRGARAPARLGGARAPAPSRGARAPARLGGARAPARLGGARAPARPGGAKSTQALVMGKRKLSTSGLDAERDDDDQNSDEEEGGEAKPVGPVIKKSGRGRSVVKHYRAFEAEDGAEYQLEDTVLVTPESKTQKPYVAMIKEIKQSLDGSLTVGGQWFYRPEEAEKAVGGYHSSVDARELFYSFHRDDVPAESVMHKCVVHFIPPGKQLPEQSKHPGHIVRRVYDAAEKRLWKLNDKDYEDSKQKEIEALMENTRKTLGDLPNEVVKAEVSGEQVKEDPALKAKKRRNLASLRLEQLHAGRGERQQEYHGSGERTSKVRLEDGGKEGSRDTPRTPQQSEAYGILEKYGKVQVNVGRTRWLEKVLHGVKYVCEAEKVEDGGGAGKGEEKGEHAASARLEGEGKGEDRGGAGPSDAVGEKGTGDVAEEKGKEKESEVSKEAGEEQPDVRMQDAAAGAVDGGHGGKQGGTDAAGSGSAVGDATGGNMSNGAEKQGGDLSWPATAVEAVSALESCVFDALGFDVHKYNLKMRSLDFNLRNCTRLARRLLLKELDPTTVLNMSPGELKEGLTSAEQTSSKEPVQPKMQMTDLTCKFCHERDVGVKDFFQVGKGDRYQFECLKCGHDWFDARDGVALLTVERVRSPTVGTAPWATSKFENVEKTVQSPQVSPRLNATDVEGDKETDTTKEPAD